MKQAPRWLPYRVRNAIDRARISAAVGPLNHTRPYTAADPRQAVAEVHLLLCRRDLRIGVLALKSLLRFGEDCLAVTVSDDGSLTDRDRGWVDRHVPNSRWLSWPTRDAAIDEALAHRDHLAELYRSRYAPVCKLLHPVVLGRCSHVILIDPDTAFFKSPKRLLDWANHKEAHAWYLHDHQDEESVVPDEAREGFKSLEAEIVSPGRPWRLEHRLFNSGLLAFCPEGMDLDLSERYLRWHKSIPGRFKTGKAEIWFGDWTPEQTCYHVMFALADPPAQPLGEDYHLGGEAGHVFNHFLQHYLVQSSTLSRLRGLISEL